MRMHFWLEQALVYGRLSRWEKTLVARHSERPYTLDYVTNLMDDWVEVHGDRGYADDPTTLRYPRWLRPTPRSAGRQFRLRTGF